MKPTALIAEDDVTTSFYLQKVLEDMGFAVITATNGAECLQELMGTRKIDVLLLDLMMPEVDGRTVLTVLESLERRGRSEQLPLVLVQTAAGELSELEVSAKHHLVDAVLRKPVEPADLRARLGSLLEAGDSPTASTLGELL